MDKEFLCKCGHRNKMHISREDALKEYRSIGRICVEYKDSICVKDVWYHSGESICFCNDFVPDNLKTLEQLSESR